MYTPIDNWKIKSYPLYQNYTPTAIKKKQTQKWSIIEEASDSSTAPNVASRTSYNAWNSPAYHLKFSM